MAKSPSPKSSGNPFLLGQNFKPMEAAGALYSQGSRDVAEAIVASLSRQIFDSDHPRPSSRLRRLMTRLSLRILRRTTRPEVVTEPGGDEVVIYRNKILERSGHPYAQTLLRPSGAHTASFVEGGNPMNGPYMMIAPEIRRNACKWDRLFLDSVIGRDVQLRFIWETKMIYEAAVRRLEKGEHVRLKAAAAGTGLSLILAFDRLIRGGYDPKLISATISDREESNVEMAERLLGSLETTGQNLAKSEGDRGIAGAVEDLLHPPSDARPYGIVTLMGILEYFPGYTSSTTEENLGQKLEEEESDAEDVLRRASEMTEESGTMIANSYRDAVGTRLLEVFGKKFRYRDRDKLHALFETAGFVPTANVGSGNIYDVEVYEKRS